MAGRQVLRITANLMRTNAPWKSSNCGTFPQLARTVFNAQDSLLGPGLGLIPGSMVYDLLPTRTFSSNSAGTIGTGYVVPADVAADSTYEADVESTDGDMSDLIDAAVNRLRMEESDEALDTTGRRDDLEGLLQDGSPVEDHQFGDAAMMEREGGEFDEVDEEEGGEDDLENWGSETNSLIAMMEGIPRKMRRVFLQKMLKVKPQEPPNLNHLKRQFQIRVVDVNRTCKVTKAGGILGFTVFVVCGNRDGAVGFGKGKSAEVSAAVDKAYARSIRNLHVFDRWEGRTIPRPEMAKYEKTKVYLWPGREGTGLKAGPTVAGILRLAGFKDMKTKVIGSRHPHNTVKATFLALSKVATPEESWQIRDAISSYTKSTSY